MLTNEQMKEGRFLRWAKARAKVAKIRATLQNGGKVVVGTYTRATQYDARHVEMFKATRSGAYVQRGKNWDCIDYAGIRFGG